jgi:hypothetical protein
VREVKGLTREDGGMGTGAARVMVGLPNPRGHPRGYEEREMSA